MLEFYLMTVIIYVCAIYGLLYLFSERIYENNWTNVARKTSTDPRIILLFLSAVPILRLVIVLCIIYMTTHTKEEFEKYKK